jgi:hypothetical protein
MKVRRRKISMLLGFALAITISLFAGASSFNPSLFAPVAARAATDTPHVVISGEIWLMDENGNKIFLLPDTYYARINNLDDNYYYITFNGVPGKVSKNVVSTVGYHTTAKGTSFDIQVSPDYSEFVGINLKSSPSLSANNVVVIPTSDYFTFIGEYPSSEGEWYYVKYNQYYGYIRQERTTAPVLNIETFTPEAAPANNDPGGSNSDPGKGILSGIDQKGLRIIIIVGLAVPAILIIFLIFRPSKNKKYYD